jgi:hypothetical protein
MVLHNYSRVNTDLLSIPASIKHSVYNQTKFVNDAAGSHGAATLLESMGCSLSCNQARQSRCHNGRAELIGFGVCLGCPSKESGKAARQDIALAAAWVGRRKQVTRATVQHKSIKIVNRREPTHTPAHHIVAASQARHT